MAEPVIRDIWSGMQADKQLLAVSRAQRGLLAEALRRAYPDSDPDALARCAFLVWELGEATVRLAISMAPEERRALVDIFKRMTLREFAEPVSPPAPA